MRAGLESRLGNNGPTVSWEAVLPGMPTAGGTLDVPTSSAARLSSGSSCAFGTTWIVGSQIRVCLVTSQIPAREPNYGSCSRVSRSRIAARNATRVTARNTGSQISGGTA